MNQLSIFDILEEIKPEQDEEKEVLENNTINNSNKNIELMGHFYLASEFFEIKISFWKVNEKDFYNGLFFYFPKSGIKCEYDLNAEIAKNNKQSSYYLSFIDLRDYLHMRLIEFDISNKNEFKDVKEALIWFDDLLERELFK